MVLYRNQSPVNFSLHFAELHSGISIRHKTSLFENYFHNCYRVKKIISFKCISENIYMYHKDYFDVAVLNIYNYIMILLRLL